jgi:tetratricopeptide (TPR) repeat protein
MPIDLPKNHAGQRIDSWKEIAAFFGRDERTVKRWEKERHLPVYRVPGGRGTVYAYTEELTAWLRSSQQREAPGPVVNSENGSKSGAAPEDGISHFPLETNTPVLPGKSPATSKTWLFLGVGMLLLFVVLTGVPRFFQLRSVEGHLLPTVARRTVSAPHKEAEDLYLQGRYYWNKRTPEGLTLALDDFNKAAQLDPNYALAYAGQADCYNLLREYTSMPPSQAFPLAIKAATKAVELDDQLPEGHRALGFAYFYWNWDMAGGEREFRRAIELSPSDVEAHHWYATALLSAGRYSEAVTEIEQARRLDPMSSSIAADRAFIFFGNGRQDVAIQMLLQIEKSEPNFLSPYVYLKSGYFDRKEYLKSFEQAEMAARLSHDDKEITSIELSKKRFEEGGEHAMLEGRLADQLLQFQQGHASAVDVAKTYALLGQNKEALEYLQKGYQRHEYELITIGEWPGFNGIRQEPEFQDILKHLGLRTPHST